MGLLHTDLRFITPMKEKWVYGLSIGLLVEPLMIDFRC
jgi:hypothetical protein